MKNNIIKIWIYVILGVLIFIFSAIVIENYIKNKVLLNILLSLLTILFLIYNLIISKKILEVCYYECKNCKHLFKPKYKTLLFSPHIGSRKLLECSKCKEKNWNKIKSSK